jgi:hypothetical protein
VLNANLVTDVGVHRDCVGGVDYECGFLVVGADGAAALGADEPVLGLGHEGARSTRANSSGLGSRPSFVDGLRARAQINPGGACPDPGQAT